MGRFNLQSLQKRTISALILAPIFLAIILYGQLPFLIFLAAAFGVAAYEWFGLTSKLKDAQLVALVTGVLYLAISFYSFYLCRGLGGAHIFLLLFMVWASDIGAYFFGKFIGGPKLIPQVSPNKTWAGLGGALLSPALVLLGFVLIYEGGAAFDLYLLALFMVVGGIIGIIGQAGDLLMSHVKRQAGVKDTGHLIPGHGGLLDRIDSLLLVTPVFYVLLKYMSVIVAVI